jgi:hypothetical protein
MRLWPLALLAVVPLAGCHQAEADHWKRKYTEEVNFHYQTQHIKNAEVSELQLQLKRQAAEIDALKARVAELERK